MEIAGVEVSGIEVFMAKPGDIVFVSVPGKLREDSVNYIRTAFKQLLPDGVKCAILQEGMTLHVIRPESESDHPAPEPKPERKVNFREFT